MTDGAEPRRVGFGALVLLLRALKRAMNADQLDISLTLVPGCDSSGLQVQVKEKFSSLNYAICQWAELNIIHTYNPKREESREIRRKHFFENITY